MSFTGLHRKYFYTSTVCAVTLCACSGGKLLAEHQYELSARVLRLILGTFLLTYHLLSAFQDTCQTCIYPRLLRSNPRQKGNGKQPSTVADRMNLERMKKFKWHPLQGFMFKEIKVFLVILQSF